MFGLGTILSDAIRQQFSVPGETSILWKADSSVGNLLIKPAENNTDPELVNISLLMRLDYYI